MDILRPGHCMQTLGQRCQVKALGLKNVFFHEILIKLSVKIVQFDCILIKYDSYLEFRRLLKNGFYVFGAEGVIFSTAVIAKICSEKITDFLMHDTTFSDG